MDFLIGGLAACGAGFFTNPLEVVKTRMQLQGELKARGQYHKVYPNFPTAFITIVRKDGVLAVQKGLIPALWYQLTMNGFRLGVYQCAMNALPKDSEGQVSTTASLAAGAVAGAVGAAAGSPFYMVSTV